MTRNHQIHSNYQNDILLLFWEKVCRNYENQRKSCRAGNRIPQIESLHSKKSTFSECSAKHCTQERETRVKTIGEPMGKRVSHLVNRWHQKDAFPDGSAAEKR